MGSFFLTMILILAIAIVFDISEKIDDFQNGATMNEIVFDYYINFIAFYGNLFSALILFISTIWFTSRITSNSEVVAVLTSGTSFNRFLRPYFIGATIICLFSLTLNHLLVPHTNIKRIAFEEKYITGVSRPINQKVHRQVLPGHYVYFETYSGQRQSGYQFTYEVFNSHRLVSKLSADFVRLDTATGKWRLDNFRLRTLDTLNQEVILTGRRMDTTLAFTSEQIAPKLSSIATMNSSELSRFIEQEEVTGNENIASYQMEMQRRTSYPVSSYVFVLLAVSLATQKRRGGLGINIAIGLILCAVYVFAMQISQTFAATGLLSIDKGLGRALLWVGIQPAEFAIWIPNILFAGVAIWRFSKAPK
jgi:lipopolysaccharide export system permease protein